MLSACIEGVNLRILSARRRLSAGLVQEWHSVRGSGSRAEAHRLSRAVNSIFRELDRIVVKGTKEKLCQYFKRTARWSRKYCLLSRLILYGL